MNHVDSLLTELGYDTSQEEIKETPKRYYNYIKEFTKKNDNDFIDYCSKHNIKRSYSKPTENIKITLNSIFIRSMCQHHILPFYGNVFISYVSKGYTLGLSKFKRIIDFASTECTTQEHLTKKIATYIMNILPVKNIYIKLVCTHTCMIVRGIKDINSYTTTEIHILEDEYGVRHIL